VFLPLTWKKVSIGNDVWVCDNRRGNSSKIKTLEIGGEEGWFHLKSST
jgi:hypothetical protein